MHLGAGARKLGPPAALVAAADWRTRYQPPSPPQHRRIQVVPMMNKAQTDIAYGFPSVRRAEPGYYACWLMNNILGEYSLGGREHAK